MFNINNIRGQFPFLKNNKIYFDSAATSLKLSKVIDSEVEYYKDFGVNTGRGSSILNYNTTNMIENIRKDVSKFIGASNSSEIVFTSNSTDSINLVAKAYVKNIIKPISNIVITQLEHHSNYVPWIELAREFNIECRVIPLNGSKLDLSNLDAYIDENTIITCITGMSNITGEVIDLKKIISCCRKYSSKILIDAAQLITHKVINVSNLDIDFLVFSSHKLFGTFGLGFLYGKKKLLETFTPVKFGGNMVTYISDNGDINYHDVPRRLESGTQNPAAIYAFKEVLNFLELYPISKQEQKIECLSSYLIDGLNRCDGIKLYSSSGSIVSFNINGVHSHDASDFFDQKNILVRVGNMCASAFFKNKEESGTIRVSLGIFNTTSEIDLLLKTVVEIKEFFL